MFLPSYEEATAKPDHWRIIRQYVTDRGDVLSCCLVSKCWYQLFAPLLWARPTKWLGKDSHMFRKYDFFAKTAWRARYETRALVTELDFRAMKIIEPSDFASSDPWSLDPNIDDHYLWFHQIAALLPSLKFLVVDGLGAFSTAAAFLDESKAFRTPNSTSVEDRPLQVTQGSSSSITTGASSFFELGIDSERADPLENDHTHQSLPRDKSFLPVVLSAADCRYLEPSAVSSRLWSNDLLYLDVSGTCKQRSRELFTRENLPNLRILKLRNLRLTTMELIPILKSLALRLFSLDLRDNQLTDDVIRQLLLSNFMDPFEQRSHLRPIIDEEGNLVSHTSSSSRCASPERYIEDAPAYSERRDVSEEQETLVVDGGRVELRPDDVDSVINSLKEENTLKTLLKHGVPGEGNSLTKTTGLTHLYISGNKLTSDGVKSLLMGTNRLQVLDVGSVTQAYHRFSSKYQYVKPECQPDTVKLLVPAVSQRLQTLRIHHSIITHTPTLQTSGEFHISEKRRIHLAEEEYAVEELSMWPVEFNPDMNPRIQSLTLTSVPQKSLGVVIRPLLRFLRAVAVQESLIAKAKPTINSRRSAQMLPGIRLIRLEFERRSNHGGTLANGPSVSQEADADIFQRESANDFSFFNDNSESRASAATNDFSFFSGEISSATGGSSQRSQSVSPMSDEVEASVLRDVKEEIRAYRMKTTKAYEAERKRLGKGARVPLGAPHYHWTGRLEFVS